MSWLPDWITGYDAENAARAREADAKLRALNAERISNGFYTPEAVKQLNDGWARDAMPASDADARAAIDAAFVDGLNDGRNNVKGFFNGVVWQFLKSIPFVVWVGAAVALFVWLGGLSLLKGRLARK